ncbi:MAG: hypothetical protein BroJett038_35230 [Chloroflexota bacterium]|nr:MAG: hypothetical protein BroJett038_35230 [Chloroflexota bacterium]
MATTLKRHALRIIFLFALAAAAGLTADWFRDDRVLFPRALPVFTEVSNAP